MATELAKAYVQIIPSAKGMAGNLKKELGDAQAGEQAGSVIGGGLAKKLLGVVAAAGIGAAIVKGIKSSIEAGGALQQSLGGVETIFGQSADTVIKNAERAYKTAGLSANKYMENVTGFGASLLQSLGGDTVEASKVADRAIIDMADNANKFGTSMDSITYAYQGFAKQNFTMLDNLKLGYGGTKTEMQRLVKDAANMKDIQEELGVTIDENSLSFANVANAISVVQRALGVAGTTATEAEGTFTGSMMAMQASVENFKAHLALGQDVTEDIQSIATSVSTFVFTNLLPMIGNIIKGLPKAIGTFIKTAVPQIAEQGKEFLKAFGQGFVRGVLNIGKFFSDAMSKFLEFVQNWTPGENLGVAEKIIDSIGKALANIVPALMARFSEGLDNLIKAIDAWNPTGAGEAGKKIIDMIGNAIKTYAPTILKSIGIVLGKLGLAILKALPKLAIVVGMLVEHLGMLALQGLQMLGQLILQGLVALLGLIFGKIKDLAVAAFEGVKTAIMTPINAIHNFIISVWNAITTFLSTVWNTIKSVAVIVWNAIKTVVMTPVNAVRTIIQNVWNAIKNFLSNAWNNIKNTASTVWETIKSKIITPIQNAWNTLTGIVDSIKQTLSDAWDSVKSTAQNMWESIKSAITKPIEDAKDTISGIVEKIKGFFPISIGKWLSNLPSISLKTTEKTVLGKTVTIPTGFEWNAKAMQQPYMFSDATLFGAGEAGDEILYGRRALMRDIKKATSERTSGDATYNFNIYPSQGMDAREIANEVYSIIVSKEKNRRTAWA